MALSVDPALTPLLGHRFRRPEVPLRLDGSSSLGHLVEAAGVPLTEVGRLYLDGAAVPASTVPVAAGRLRVAPVDRPQAWPSDPLRLVLDVHLGSLARRLRLLGLDAIYRNDTTDDDLLRTSRDERRVLLTQDRSLLRRRALFAGAFVRGQGVEAQVEDVLDRFAPPLRPWTRCPACGDVLVCVDRQHVEHLLEPGTRRTYDEFSRCEGCGRPFWSGAHAHRLDAAVRRAQAVVARRRAAPRAASGGSR